MGTHVKAIIVFVSVTYLLAAALGLVVGLSGGPQSPLVGLGFLGMLIPAAGVLILRWAMNERAHIDWSRFPVRYLPLALLSIPLVLHATMLPLMAVFEGGHLPWAAWLTPSADGLYHSPAERGWGVLTLGALARRIALNAIVGVLAVAVLAFFEEIGWRAWLLPRLAQRLGPRRAVVATAVIAALWHTPYALSGIHYFEGVDPIVVALFAPLGHIAAALVIGWLWLRTESVWIVSLAHGALNNWGQYAFKYMDEPTSGGGSDGIVLLAGLIVLLLVGAALLKLAPGKASGDRELPLEARARA